jgi:hypothetical protein
MLQQILKGCQRILELSLHFLEKRMDFQEFAEKLWETMNSVGRLRVVLEDSVKNFVSEHMLLFLPLSHTSYSSC